MSTEQYTFTCPECGGTIPVDDAIRDALLREGCVHCGSSVPTNAFGST